MTRILKEALNGIIKNFSVSIASIITISITLLLAGSAYLFFENVAKFVVDTEEKIEIRVVIEKENAIPLEEIKKNIENTENVETVRISTKDDELNFMKESIFKDQEEMVDELFLANNPLSDYMFVTVVNNKLIDKTVEDIKKIVGVKDIKYNQDTVKTMLEIFDTIRNVSVFTIGTLFVVAVFLITNTIKLGIISRRREIEIMRLVGAGNFFIRMPFIFEGIFIGLLGSIIPIFVLDNFYTTFYDSLNNGQVLSFVSIVEPKILIPQLLLAIVGISVIVGMIGSLFGIRKYLKV